MGPRNAVRRNQYQGERFRVRAKPPARIATLSHIAETIDVRVPTSCMARHYRALQLYRSIPRPRALDDRGARGAEVRPDRSTAGRPEFGV